VVFMVWLPTVYAMDIFFFGVVHSEIVTEFLTYLYCDLIMCIIKSGMMLLPHCVG
jgi:hypothetical protein